MPVFKPIPTFTRDDAGKVHLTRSKFYVRDFHLNVDRTGEVVCGGSGTPTATRVGLFTLSDEFHFEAVKMSVSSDGPFLIHFYWQGGNSDLMNRPIDSRLIVGNGQREYPLPTSLWMRARSSLKMTCENLTTERNRIRVLLHGRAIFYKLAMDSKAGGEAVKRLITSLDCKVSYPVTTSRASPTTIPSGTSRIRSPPASGRTSSRAAAVRRCRRGSRPSGSCRR
jgi:hypothetical protein